MVWNGLLQLLPMRMLRQRSIELLQERGFVVASECAGKETVQTFCVETFPRRFFVAWDDWKKERPIGFSGFVIARCIADHQDFCGWILVFRGKPEMVGFGAHLLPGDDFDEFVDAMLGPFAFEGFSGRLRNAHRIGLFADLNETFAYEWKGRHAMNDIFNSGVDRVGPDFDLRE